jgi:hypothetical protein
MVAKLHWNWAASVFRETPAFRADKIEALSTGVSSFRFTRVGWVLADGSVPEVGILAWG